MAKKNQMRSRIIPLLILIMTTTISSCSRKTVGITKTYESTLDSSATSTKEQMIIKDQSVISTTEQTDTVVKTKADTATASFTIDPASNNETIQESESQSNGVKVKLQYNPKTKRINATAIKDSEEIVVKATKTTVEKKDVVTDASKQSDSASVLRTDKSSYQKTKDRKGISFGGWLGMIGGGILLLFLIIIFVPGIGGKVTLLLRKIFSK